MQRLSIVCVAALVSAACNRDNLPDDSFALRPGSMERFVVDLPADGDFADLYTHPVDEDLVLVRLNNQRGSALLTLDARRGEFSTWCNSAQGGYDGPTAVGWRNDEGLWDVIDDRLYLVAQTYDDAYTIVSCGADGQPVPEVRAGETWPQTAVPVDGAILTWLKGEDHPILRRYSGPDEALPWPHPTPHWVAKNNTATGLAVVTIEGDALVLREIDREEYEVREVGRITLGAETYTPESGIARVRSTHPGAFVVLTDSGNVLVNGGPELPTWPGPAEIAPYDGNHILPYPDRSGFRVHGLGVSMNVHTGLVHTEGHVTPTGHHVVFSGGTPEALEVKIFANNGDSSPSDGPVTTWTVDLTTHYDWLSGVAEDATYEGFGFDNGVCGVARWGMSWGMEGRRIPYDPGDMGWHVADSVVYLGPCDGSAQPVARELWVDGFVFYWHGSRVLKSDVPMFSVTHGERLEEGFNSLFSPFAGWDLWTYGWGMDSRGDVHALWDGATWVMPQRHGTRIWTYHDADRTLHRVDAARLAR